MIRPSFGALNHQTILILALWKDNKKEHPVSDTEEQGTEEWNWNQQEGSKTKSC